MRRAVVFVVQDDVQLDAWSAELEEVIVRVGQPECASTSFELTSDKKTLEAWSTKAAVPELHFVSGGTERKIPTPQKATITDWQAQLGPQHDWLEGPVRFATTGLSGELTLRRGDVVPDMKVTCR